MTSASSIIAEAGTLKSRVPAHVADRVVLDGFSLFDFYKALSEVYLLIQRAGLEEKATR